MAKSFKGSGEGYPERKAERDLFTGMNKLTIMQNNWKAYQEKQSRGGGTLGQPGSQLGLVRSPAVTSCGGSLSLEHIAGIAGGPLPSISWVGAVLLLG
jgi:hypothetical protein